MKSIIFITAIFLLSCHSKPVVSVRWMGDTLVIYSPTDIDVRLDSNIVQRTFTSSDSLLRGMYITGKKGKEGFPYTIQFSKWIIIGNAVNDSGSLFNSDSTDSIKIRAPIGIFIGHSRNADRRAPWIYHGRLMRDTGQMPDSTWIEDGRNTLKPIPMLTKEPMVPIPFIYHDTTIKGRDPIIRIYNGHSWDTSREPVTIQHGWAIPAAHPKKRGKGISWKGIKDIGGQTSKQIRERFKRDTMPAIIYMDKDGNLHEGATPKNNQQ